VAKRARARTGIGIRLQPSLSKRGGRRPVSIYGVTVLELPSGGDADDGVLSGGAGGGESGGESGGSGVCLGGFLTTLQYLLGYICVKSTITISLCHILYKFKSAYFS